MKGAAQSRARLKKKKTVEQKADSVDAISPEDTIRYAGFWKHVRHGVQLHDYALVADSLNQHRAINLGAPSEVSFQ